MTAHGPMLVSRPGLVAIGKRPLRDVRGALRRHRDAVTVANGDRGAERPERASGRRRPAVALPNRFLLRRGGPCEC